MTDNVLPLAAARKKKAASGGGGGGKGPSTSVRVRKHRLTADEIRKIEKAYGLKSDGLPLDRAGHAERVFNMAKASKTEILFGTDNRWRIYDPDTGRWLDDDITRFRFNEYVIQVGNLMYQNATDLKRKLDAGAVKEDMKAEVIELIKIYEAQAKGLRTTQDPVRNVAAAKATEEKKYLVEPSDFDSDKDRILVRNCIIDLRTGKPLPHGIQHKFTRWIDLDYDPKVTAPTFNRFIDYVLPDIEVREWVQRWSGYCLTGHIDEQLLTILLGVSGSGKSTLVKLLARTMGKVGRHGYARRVPEGLFRKSKSHWGDQARLKDARLAHDSEFEQDTVLNAERIRTLTGEDEIDGNEKMKAFKYFDLLAKFMISTNTMPPMSVNDPTAVREATMRRLMIVRMDQPMIPHWSADELPQFFADLYAERAGVLAWMVAGAKAWYQKPLTVDVPAAIELARSAYAKQSGITDPIQAALDDAGFVFDPNLFCWSEDLQQDIGAVATEKKLSIWLPNHGVTVGGRKRKPGEPNAKATWKGIGKPV